MFPKKVRGVRQVPLLLDYRRAACRQLRRRWARPVANLSEARPVVPQILEGWPLFVQEDIPRSTP